MLPKPATLSTPYRAQSQLTGTTSYPECLSKMGIRGLLSAIWPILNGQWCVIMSAMKFFRIQTSVFVLLVALCANNLHQWLPHADETACEVCIHQSHDGWIDSPTESGIVSQQTPLNGEQFIHQIFNSPNPLNEPARGSPSLS